jgi:crotonobetainyl-CoA:carnitine CoA-transferase CaiB-like acyl-CoA transferase
VTAPLADVRVIAIEQYGAGPFATMQLADLGADVIRVEDPSGEGDAARHVPPFAEHGTSLFFESFNRNKRSVALDIRSARGRETLERLVRRSDALVYNLRGDLPEKLRLRYQDLRAVNERIVCVSLSAFGTDGPRLAQGGYDFTLQGIAGWMSLTGGPDEPPTKSGLSLVDYCAGYTAAIAVLAGVHQARRDGVGTDVDLSLFDVAFAQLTYVGTWYLTKGYRPPRRASSAHLSMVPFQSFATADGYVVVACPKDELWRRLCDALDRRDLLADARFGDYDARAANREALVEILSSELGTRTTAECVSLLEKHRVPCGAVNDLDAAFADPQVAARNTIASYPHPTFGQVRTAASPLRMRGPIAMRRAPFRGEHTREVLREIAELPDQEMQTLLDDGLAGSAGEVAR